MITGGVASGATTRRTKYSFGRMTRTSAIFSDDVASKLYLESSALHSTARLPFGLRSRSPVANVNFDGHFRRNRSFLVRRFAKGSQDVACDDAKKVRDMYRSHVSHAARSRGGRSFHCARSTWSVDDIPAASQFLPLTRDTQQTVDRTKGARVFVQERFPVGYSRMHRRSIHAYAHRTSFR